MPPVAGDRRARFMSKIDKTATCWLWIGGLDAYGYGQFDRHDKAHRVAYEMLVGPIPEGLVIDHLCRVRRCVNPEHMEPVTHGENNLRGIGPAAVHAAQTHCIRGHEFTPENTYIWRD